MSTLKNNKIIKVEYYGSYTDRTGIKMCTQSEDGTKYEIKIPLQEFKDECKFIYEEMRILEKDNNG